MKSKKRDGARRCTPPSASAPYSKHNAAICFGDSMQAALFFDRVLPITPHAMWSDDGKSITMDFRTLEEDVLNELVSPNKIRPAGFAREFTINGLFGDILFFMHKDRVHDPDRQFAIDYLADIYVPPRKCHRGCCVISNGESIRHIVSRYATMLNFSGANLVLPTKELPENTPANISDEDTTVAITGLNLIDTSKCTWEQIIAVRRDPDAKRKLRALRLFLHETYTGKSRAFIEDDLCNRIQQYEQACKDYRFETITSSLDVIADSKSLPALGVATTVAVLCGEPLTATATALAGASIEIGKIAIELAKRKHAIQKLEQDHGLAYVFSARKRLSI